MYSIDHANVLSCIDALSSALALLYTHNDDFSWTWPASSICCRLCLFQRWKIVLSYLFYWPRSCLLMHWHCLYSIGHLVHSQGRLLFIMTCFVHLVSTLLIPTLKDRILWSIVSTVTMSHNASTHEALHRPSPTLTITALACSDLLYLFVVDFSHSNFERAYCVIYCMNYDHVLWCIDTWSTRLAISYTQGGLFLIVSCFLHLLSTLVLTMLKDRLVSSILWTMTMSYNASTHQAHVWLCCTLTRTTFFILISFVYLLSTLLLAILKDRRHSSILSTASMPYTAWTHQGLHKLSSTLTRTTSLYLELLARFVVDVTHLNLERLCYLIYFLNDDHVS